MDCPIIITLLNTLNKIFIKNKDDFKDEKE